MSAPADDTFVFNVVFTGPGFTFLRYFVASQLAQSEARFRLVANDCPPEQVALMERFARAHPRVIEVLDVDAGEMIPHGAALDVVHRTRDDGDHFCFIDPDIKARGPFVADFAARLADDCAAVSSGRGIWTETDRVPEGHQGIAGEHFYSPTGYVYGSPHFAMYRRGPLDEVTERWGVGFASRGPDLRDDTRARLADVGHEYWLYDTGKVVNILLQEDGHPFCHSEHPALLHVGGMSHFLTTMRFMHQEKARLEVARYSADVLRSCVEGQAAPPIPPDADPILFDRLTLVRDELVDLVARYDAFVRDGDD